MTNNSHRQFRRRAALKRTLGMGASVAVIALAAASSAFAADPAPAATAASSTVGEIVVSASRITAAGFNAPTPTTVLGADLIAKQAQPNLFTAITQLPSLQGSTGTTVANGNTSTGATGLSSLNLRGLGTFRTLTLIDGQRVVPAYVTGVTDISQFPQLLIQRVDVVTGGASASYGSDAVGGVVNFVTNKRFEGLKINIQGGETTYHDDANGAFQVAYGSSFLDHRAHLQLSGEYYHSDGVRGEMIGGIPIDGRPALPRSSSTSTSLTGTPAGAPQFSYYPDNAQTITQARNGLITAGPLQGYAFGANGVPYLFQYGGSGIPNKTSAGGVQGCIGNICQGGTVRGLQSSAGGGSDLDALINRSVGYGRFSFEATPAMELSLTVNLSKVFTITSPTRGTPKPNLTAQCDNAFLNPLIPQLCAANHITSFTWGTIAENLENDIRVKNTRELRRVVLGADGAFDALGKPWTYSAYAEHGETITNVHIDNVPLTPLYNAAIDAVRNSAGQIVCRSAAAQAAGCIPYNPFGDVTNSAAAFRWFAPAIGPHQYSFQRQEAASIAFNGTPFHLSAGDVSLAFGAEWREEAYHAVGDAYGAGAASTPFSADYPSIPLLAASADNWYAGNFHNGGGRYDVVEGFVESGLPLWSNDAFGKASLDLAARATNYSTSGLVYTWKVGGTWDTPIDGVKLRAVRSQDIRAPNLSDLYAAAINMNNFVINRANGASVQILNEAVGNPALTPEISANLEAGVVYRPTWMRGLSLSFDYFDINMRKAIQSLTNQQIVDLCYNGNTAICSNVFLGGTPGTATPSYVVVRPFNLASLKTNGFDIESSYQFNLNAMGVPGAFTLRGLFTRTFNYITDTGVTGQQVAQLAGNNNLNATNQSGVPLWKAFVQQSWAVAGAQFTLTERLIAPGMISPNYIVCTSACPATTVQNPTSNFNHINGATYVDFGVSYDVRKATQVYGKVDNLFNVQIPTFGSNSLYDTLGRRFIVGVRQSF